MSDIPSFLYHIFWEKHLVESFANLTNKDGE